MASTFRGVIEFFVRLGIYDVVLPFLLVFTIVFAILEKTKVLGTENDMTKKNLNAMVAFVTAFLVVASSRLVAIINETMANMVLLLMLSVCFLLLIGSFMKQTKEGVSLDDTWMKPVFIIIMFVGIILIFMNALGWLYPAWQWLLGHYDSTVVASLILVAIVVGVMWVLVKDPKTDKSKSSD